MFSAERRAVVLALTIINSKIEQGNTVNAIFLFQAKSDKDQKVNPHLEVKIEEADRLSNNWMKTFQVSDKYARCKNRFPQMREEFTSM